MATQYTARALDVRAWCSFLLRCASRRRIVPVWWRRVVFNPRPPAHRIVRLDDVRNLYRRTT